MENIELQNIWKSYDKKMDSILAVNKELAINLTRQKLSKQISRLYRPKWTAIIIGVPYTLFLVAITAIAFMANAFFVTIGFGAIAAIMIILLLYYFIQLHLISKIKNSQEVLSTQQQLSKLRISSFKSLNLAIFQLPFWSLCWISMDAIMASPLIYGGINLIVFLFLSYIAFWLHQKLSYKNERSKIRDFFLSGNEWEPIIKSSQILEQIKEYEK